MIELKNIRVTFNKHTPLENTVIQDMSLNINDKEFVTIIGGNGAGKSTLLNCIAGEVRPEKGDIVISGKKVTKRSTADRARWVSRVFQDPLQGTCADLTIEENLLLATHRGKRRGFALAYQKKLVTLFKERLSELNLGLQDRLDTQIGSLSGGQRQAVSLVMATLEPPQILLLDEHTAALDPKMANTIMDITARLIKEYQFTTLMITHSMHQALHYGTRTLLLQQGQILRDLTCEERKKLTAQDLLTFFE